MFFRFPRLEKFGNPGKPSSNILGLGGFSRHLGDDTGQVFVFFILTVAAAEAAIGLAILVVLFRNQRSINVQELNTMKG